MSQKRPARGEKIANRYKVYSRLRGGMGEVYFCLDQETNQPLALKTPWMEEDADPERVTRLNERFLREARTWVALGQHPNIVRCFYLDTIEEQPWLFLEWITAPDRKHTSLRDWIKERGALNLEQALGVALDICHGLAHAASVQPGLVHRDLKPGNVLIAQDLTAKISDFGLARRWNGLGHRKERGGVGTPAYRPPEQWQSGDVDARSDIYALGIILYESLLARRPFAAESDAELQVAHASTPPPDLPDYLPQDVNAIIQRCLRKNAADRFQSIEEVAAALGDAVRANLGREPAPTPAAGHLTAGDLVNRGNTYVRIKHYADALPEYTRALELDPAFAPALENRGAVYWMVEQPEAVMADLDRAIQIDPHSYSAYYNRAVVLAERGQPMRALQDYNSALSLAPGLPAAHFNRGNLLRDMGKHAQALVDFTRAIALAPKMAEAYHNRGLTHLELLNYQAALEDFSKAIELSPSLAAARFNRGVIYQILGRYDEALQDFDAAIQSQPKFRQAWEQRATVHHHLGEYQHALEDYTRAILLGPDERVDLYYNRGLVLIEMGEYEAAILNFDHAIAVDRHYLPAHLERARALLLEGRNEEAHLVCTGLLAIGFESAGLHYRLSELFTALGDEESAAEALTRAQQIEQKYAASAAEQGLARIRDTGDVLPETFVAALEAFHEAASPEQVQSLLAAYPFMADPSFISAAEQSIAQRQSGAEPGTRRKKVADEARLLWLRTYARL